LVMVLGDRLEMLAAACAALAERVPLAHVHGGETAPGIWDEQIRHAITKMAQVHFCATETAGRRIVRMGEEPGRVHVVGAPALDLAEMAYRKLRQRRRPSHGEGGIHGNYGGGVLLLHPTSDSEAREELRAHMVLEALHGMPSGLDIIGPNNDPGYRGILRAYERSGLAVTMNVSQEKFWELLSRASYLIGNSSSGIIEAATFGIPVVNIGERQAGRERNDNVIDVAWNREKILDALVQAWEDRRFHRRVARRKNVYGDGKASERIVRLLEGLARAGGVGLEKRFCD